MRGIIFIGILFILALSCDCRKKKKYVESSSSSEEPSESSSSESESSESESSESEESSSSSSESSENDQSGRMFQMFGVLPGTLASMTNALGQTVNNYAGDNMVGDFGKMISQGALLMAGRIKYRLYTPLNQKEGKLVTLSNINGTKGFDPEHPLYIIIHGFTMGGYFERPADNLNSLNRIKDGILEANILANVIVVDWTTLSSDLTYVFASTSTATVADDISELIIGMHTKKLVKSYENVRIIGHSLGGQTAGITGRKIYEKIEQRIGRIDAIDPAGPNFDHSASVYQLGKTDAKFVMVIHCNIKTFGSNWDRGTVDFYPNGGNDLPGCGEFPGGADVCNHVRCNDLYIETIVEEMKGCKCENYKKYSEGSCDLCDLAKSPRMGYHCNETANGTYYLTVKSMKTDILVSMHKNKKETVIALEAEDDDEEVTTEPPPVTAKPQPEEEHPEGPIQGGRRFKQVKGDFSSLYGKSKKSKKGKKKHQKKHKKSHKKRKHHRKHYSEESEE